MSKFPIFLRSPNDDTGLSLGQISVLFIVFGCFIFLIAFAGCASLGKLMDGKSELSLNDIIKTGEKINDLRSGNIDLEDLELLKEGYEAITGKTINLPSQNMTELDSGGKKFQPNPIFNQPIYSMDDCRKGVAFVKLENIPIMTEANKDEINKSMFFNFESKDGSCMIAIFHRYLQPGYPYGEWWPTWRVEAGKCPCVKEWHIFDSDPLPGTTAVFRIQWEENMVKVKHMGTGDVQILWLDNNMAVTNKITRDVDCWSTEWFSTCDYSREGWTCYQEGSPTSCQR